MTTLTATRTVPAALLSRHQGLANRFAVWLLALDASYRGAHSLAHATDARLADMGIARADAEAHFARHTGTVDLPATTGW